MSDSCRSHSRSRCRAMALSIFEWRTGFTRTSVWTSAAERTRSSTQERCFVPTQTRAAVPSSNQVCCANLERRPPAICVSATHNNALARGNREGNRAQRGVFPPSRDVRGRSGSSQPAFTISSRPLQVDGRWRLLVPSTRSACVADRSPSPRSSPRQRGDRGVSDHEI